MAALASSITFHDQKDLRSAAKPFKRDRELSAKWAWGVRGEDYSNDHRTAATFGTLSAEERVNVPANYREKPRKSSGNAPRIQHKSHANMRSGDMNHQGKASSRMARKADHQYDSMSSRSLSKSLIDLLPASHPVRGARASTKSDDNTILYSFDSSSSPTSRKVVGLDALVERAEKEWAGKETERIVKKEWEILDAEGEKWSLKKGRKSPAVKAAKDAPVVDDDDWECL